jgi:lipid-A-disaccharide synthase
MKINKKTFIVAGEVSGDKLGGWYIKKFALTNVEAVGGPFLRNAGAYIYKPLKELNVAGIVEILKHLPRILSFLKNLANYILSQNFDEVVLIDFPGFNLRLAKILKKKNPNIKITYLSPPQLWAWGSWRIRSLKKYCDRVIVIYPFEVEWYKSRGLAVEWHGYPFYEEIEKFAISKRSEKKPKIALLPASRTSELTTLFPRFAAATEKFMNAHPEVDVVIPLASTIPVKKIEKAFSDKTRKRIRIIQDESEKYEALSQCCMALTKPGTITLELALLGIPSIVAFRTSWLSYYIGKAIVNIEYMALPNLLMNKEVFPEYLQCECTEEKLFDAMEKLYQSWQNQNKNYQDIIDNLEKLKSRLKA